MSAAQQRYFEWVAQRGCLVTNCTHKPSLHHVHGVRSFKTRQRLRRRDHLAEWAVIPLCRMHHTEGFDAIHKVGEEAFGVTHLGGRDGVLEWAYTLALRYLHEGRS